MKPEKTSCLPGCIGGTLWGGGIGIILGAIVASVAIDAGMVKRDYDIWALVIAVLIVVSTLSIVGGVFTVLCHLGANGGRAGSRNVEEGGGYETPEEPKETLRRKIPD